MTLTGQQKKVAEKDHHTTRHGLNTHEKKHGHGKFNWGNEPDDVEVDQDIEEAATDNVAKQTEPEQKVKSEGAK